jgi:hypothetical protein
VCECKQTKKKEEKKKEKRKKTLAKIVPSIH